MYSIIKFVVFTDKIKLPFDVVNLCLSSLFRGGAGLSHPPVNINCLGNIIRSLNKVVTWHCKVLKLASNQQSKDFISQ